MNYNEMSSIQKLIHDVYGDASVLEFSVSDDSFGDRVGDVEDSVDNFTRDARNCHKLIIDSSISKQDKLRLKKLYPILTNAISYAKNLVKEEISKDKDIQENYSPEIQNAVDELFPV